VRDSFLSEPPLLKTLACSYGDEQGLPCLAETFPLFDP
jgi:hypothetical protein